MSTNIELRKCGVRYDPPAIIITYVVKKTNKMHRRTMPLRNFNKNSGISRAAEELKSCSRHRQFLELMSTVQLEKMITMVHDRLNGMNKEDIVEKAKRLETIDPEQDLNVVDEETLKIKKAIMNQTFEKNRKKPDDPDFDYDVEKDFEPVETCDWDSGSDNGF